MEAIDINNRKIYEFDEVQLSASLGITEECEQIRGLAGTGKTVILAIKVLVDEAQDMPPEFFKLVEKVTKQPSKIIIAYDQLQTITDVEMPQFDKLFDEELKKEYDHILKKSYRNHINVLMAAVAFGFGMYAPDKKMVQIISDKANWEALGFEVKCTEK